MISAISAGRLPERYVAAKFYGNTALPDTPENHAFVASYLEELTRHIDVVLLNTGTAVRRSRGHREGDTAGAFTRSIT